jgi:oxygen-independent coproporphyrinogen-3 oxidase
MIAVNISHQKLTRLIKKYNVPGPRYTSYPTAVQFSENFDDGLIRRMQENRLSKPAKYSLYIHIPFCFSLCWYCGCTKVITKNQDRGDVYLDYLEKEMVLTKRSFHKDSSLKQIHFGGGTPTFLSPEQLRRLGKLIHSNFKVADDVEFSVEIDPRRVEKDHVKALAEIGCNRASLGVQDTNADVQKAIHRVQPFEQTRNVAGWLRSCGIEDVNLDLIYGLPLQTPSTFQKTIKDAVSLDPDRFAIYSYAHLPSVMPAQKLLNEADFPSTDEKLSMLIHAIEELPKLGYRYIGMDHFARENDDLSIALDEGTLQRNFQGYSTHAELEMIALGMSGISQGNRLYTQNDKDLDNYYSLLDSGQLPIKKILKLTDEDLIRRKIIMQIMCRGEVSYKEFFKETGIDIKNTYSEQLDGLHALESDGLLIQSKDGFFITQLGRLFLRNIAMVFDEYLTRPNHKTTYSKTV